MTGSSVDPVRSACDALRDELRREPPGGGKPDLIRLRSIVARYAWAHRTQNVSADGMLETMRAVYGEAQKDSGVSQTVSLETLFGWGMAEYFHANPHLK